MASRLSRHASGRGRMNKPIAGSTLDGWRHGRFIGPTVARPDDGAEASSSPAVSMGNGSCGYDAGLSFSPQSTPSTRCLDRLEVAGSETRARHSYLCQNARPHAGMAPAVESLGCRLPGPGPLRQNPPADTRARDPQILIGLYGPGVSRCIFSCRGGHMMAPCRHGSTRTTPRGRAGRQAWQETTRSLAARHAMNPKGVARWRHRTTTIVQRMGPPRPYVLPPDDVLGCLRETMPLLSRSALRHLPPATRRGGGFPAQALCPDHNRLRPYRRLRAATGPGQALHVPGDQPSADG
jgi:hypothetical protein